jgi:tetratricopeptide (TPR) repeat protein
MIQTRLGIVYNATGDVREALHVARGVMAALEGQVVPARFGQLAPSSVTCRVIVARCLADMGAFAEGIVVAEAAVQMAEAVAQPYSIAIALHAVGFLSRSQGDLRHAIPVLQRGLAFCQDAHITRWVPLLTSTLGVAYVLSGRTTEALPLLTQTREHVAAGHHGGSGDHLILAELSEALLLVGRVEDASALADQLLERSRTHSGRGYQAQALRLLGDIARHRDPPERELAAAYYQQALALAEEPDMRPLQAHCHRSLGTLYAAIGEQESARTELSTAIEMYQAMDMMFWLPQTETALAQMEGR